MIGWALSQTYPLKFNLEAAASSQTPTTLAPASSGNKLTTQVDEVVIFFLLFSCNQGWVQSHNRDRYSKFPVSNIKHLNLFEKK